MFHLGPKHKTLDNKVLKCQKMRKNECYISLGNEDFYKLVSGGQVDKTDINGIKVHVILSDIGWHMMLDHINTAIEQSEK